MGFVKTSIVWSIKGTCWTNTFFYRTFSLTKYRSNSTCFVLACNIGFVASCTALKLSHQIIGILVVVTLNSSSKEVNQVNSPTMIARLLYSASVDEREILYYFLEDHDTKFSTKKYAITWCRPPIIWICGPINITKSHQVQLRRSSKM